MQFKILNRKIHYWASIAVATPLFVMICSGLLLQSKKHWSWVQPSEHRGTGSALAIDLDGILASVKTVRELDVRSWDDVNVVTVQPSRGLAKVRLNSDWEVQVDLGTGRVLQTAYRRLDLIQSIHDGSFFAGNWTKLGLFVPAGLVLLLLWLSGMWMWWVPFIAKRRHTSMIATMSGSPSIKPVAAAIERASAKPR